MPRISVCLFLATAFTTCTLFASEEDVFVNTAREIHALAKKGNEAEIDSLVDQEAFFEIVRAKAQVDDVYFKDYRKASRIAGPGLGTLFKNAAQTPAFSFLHVRPIGKNFRAVFRNGYSVEMMYIELILTKNSHNKVKVLDYYIFALGAYRSDLDVEELQLSHIRAADSKTHLQMRTEETRFQQAMTQKEFRKGMDIFKRMPPQLRNTRPNLMYCVVAASHLGQKEFQEAVTDFEEFFPK